MGRGEVQLAGAKGIVIPRGEKPWVCPALKLTGESLESIQQWLSSISWPAGTEL